MNVAYSMDCMEGMKQFPDKYFDLAVVDPPYGINVANMRMGAGKSKRCSKIEFAWDNPDDDLAGKFSNYAKKAKHKPHGKYGTVYVLTNYNSTMENNLYRIYTLRDLGYDPYVMIYNKPHAPREIRLLQRWCNNKLIFGSEPDFGKYDPRKG